MAGVVVGLPSCADTRLFMTTLDKSKRWILKSNVTLRGVHTLEIYKRPDLEAPVLMAFIDPHSRSIHPSSVRGPHGLDPAEIEDIAEFLQQSGRENLLEVFLSKVL